MTSQASHDFLFSSTIFVYDILFLFKTPSGYHFALCICLTWLCKPWAGTTVHFVCVLRGYVSLGGYHCLLCVFYVAM